MLSSSYFWIYVKNQQETLGLTKAIFQGGKYKQSLNRNHNFKEIRGKLCDNTNSSLRLSTNILLGAPTPRSQPTRYINKDGGCFQFSFSYFKTLPPQRRKSLPPVLFLMLYFIYLFFTSFYKNALFLIIR